MGRTPGWEAGRLNQLTEWAVSDQSNRPVICEYKADGAFAYAALLAKHVDTKGASLGDLRRLPSGLDAMRALVSAEPEALLDA